MRCAICGMAVDSIDQAVKEGWTPYFFDDQHEHEVACPACTHALLQEGQDGEMEVKAEYRGKINFLEDTKDKEHGEHLLIGLAVVEVDTKEH